MFLCDFSGKMVVVHGFISGLSVTCKDICTFECFVHCTQVVMFHVLLNGVYFYLSVIDAGVII